MSAAGMRKAAVVLARLHPRDRAWLLDHLRPTWRYDLKRLIRTATDLGAAHATLTESVLAACDRKIEPPEPPAPDCLLAGLRDLPPAWAARVLAACAPDHLDLYAASNTSDQVRKIRSELLNVPKALPPKLTEALTRMVRERGERSLAQGYVS